MRASRRLARVGPDVLVVAAPITVPVLFKLGDRPRFVISYVRQEPGNSAGIPRWMARAGRASNGRVDLSVFPCAAWARAGLRDGVDGAFEIVHDLCQEPPEECVPARDRLARIACVDNGGRSLWPVLVEPAMRGIAVDVLGSLDEDSNHAGSAGLRTRLLQSDAAGPRYAGCPAGAELARIRRRYAYRLLDSTDAGCAALLESIADGVPAIVVARPGDAGAEMSRELVERYGCGHVIDSVNPDTCAGAMRRAIEIVGTPAHDAMIAGCGRATAREVNWEAGFAKISRHLPRRFD